MAIPSSDEHNEQLSAPVDPTERIEALDIVRGLALFGVFLVNMYDFSGPFPGAGPQAIVATPWAKAAEAFIWVFGDGAFYSQFSLLFGIGLALQMTRAIDRGERYGLRLVSRLVILACFGFAHTVLLWDGDILLAYAFAGLPFLLFARLKPRTGVWWAAGLCSLSIIGLLGITTLVYFIEPSMPATAADIQADIDEYLAIGFAERTTSQLTDWASILGSSAISVPWFVGTFLVGSWIVTAQKLFDWKNQQQFLRNVLKVSLPIAIVTKGLVAVIYFSGSVALADSVRWPLTTLIGGPALGAVYLSGTLLVLAQPPRQLDAGRSRHTLAQRVLRLFAPIGRMALTNYLAQSVMGVLLFRSYGLGLYGQLDLGVVILLTICLFAAQMVISRLWLSVFAFGPMEWLWRSLTYRSALKTR